MTARQPQTQLTQLQQSQLQSLTQTQLSQLQQSQLAQLQQTQMSQTQIPTQSQLQQLQQLQQQRMINPQMISSYPYSYIPQVNTPLSPNPPGTPNTVINPSLKSISTPVSPAGVLTPPGTPRTPMTAYYPTHNGLLQIPHIANTPGTPSSLTNIMPMQTPTSILPSAALRVTPGTPGGVAGAYSLPIAYHHHPGNPAAGMYTAGMANVSHHHPASAAGMYMTGMANPAVATTVIKTEPPRTPNMNHMPPAVKIKTEYPTAPGTSGHTGNTPMNPLPPSMGMPGGMQNTTSIAQNTPTIKQEPPRSMSTSLLPHDHISIKFHKSKKEKAKLKENPLELEDIKKRRNTSDLLPDEPPLKKLRVLSYKYPTLSDTAEESTTSEQENSPSVQIINIKNEPTDSDKIVAIRSQIQVVNKGPVYKKIQEIIKKQDLQTSGEVVELMCMALQEKMIDIMQKAVVLSQQRLDDQKHRCQYVNSSNPRKYLTDILLNRQKVERERRENIEKQRLQFEAQQNPRVKESPQARLTRERFDADKAAEVALHQIRRNTPSSIPKPPAVALTPQYLAAYNQLHELYLQDKLQATYYNQYRQLYSLVEQWKKYERDKENYQLSARSNFSSPTVSMGGSNLGGTPNSNSRGGPSPLSGPGSGGSGNSGSMMQSAPAIPVLRKVTKKDIMVFVEQDPFIKNTGTFFKTFIGIKIKPREIT